MRRRPGLAIVLAAATAAVAHPGVYHEIDRLTAEIAAAPGNPALLIERAYVLRVAGQPGESLRDLDAARRLDGASPRIAAERGLTLAALGRDREAEVELDAFLSDGAGTVATWTERARIRARRGAPRPALSDYRRALALRPDAELYLECGGMLEGIPDMDSAAALYREGLERVGGAVTIRSALVRVELSRGRPEAAVRLLDDEVAAAAVKTEPLLRRATALEAAGRSAEARADRERALGEAERAVAKNPTALHLLSRAKAKAALGRTGEAEADLVAALERSPQFGPASELLHQLRDREPEARTKP